MENGRISKKTKYWILAAAGVPIFSIELYNSHIKRYIIRINITNYHLCYIDGRNVNMQALYGIDFQ